ncbi:hypothetical protein [Treponema phagedenis]|uniref:hypothetical protein n=1 Tax=Treponema phagedenis TaxID=162 RepID=UPI0004637155|nr:hypothetical protein [Treponema phagedenis]
MSKAHRGKGILDKTNRSRGTCLVTGQTGVKLLYEQEIDGKKVNISKIGRAVLKNKKAAEAKKEAPAEKTE